MKQTVLLGVNRTIDRTKRVVEANQIIQMKGCGYDKDVVYEKLNRSAYSDTID